MNYQNTLFFLMFFLLSCTHLFSQDTGNPTLKQEKTYKLTFENEPLYIVNGKKVDKKALDTLKSPLITHIEVIKPPQSTEKYGEEGKYGVILFFLKHKDAIKEKEGK